ncbi:MAG: OmpH family outer membrane protein [Deltaproteobacteria bacterium]|nr:OmpH family outer membrane protein [Candidatus Anaeroferrophillus wilburensis]MBN2889749.1 OmpH family outer membrane protein [Deltaproteobacteria bacterium]
MVRHKILTVMLVVGFILTVCPFVGATDNEHVTKIAYIDLQKVMALSEEGKQARESLEKKRAEMGKLIQEKKNQLDQVKEELERQGMMLSKEARAEKEAEYQKEVRDFKRYVADSEEELKKTYEELTKAILQDLEKVVVQVGQEGKYTMILGRQESAIFYADKKVDISQQVIDAYNAWKQQPAPKK